MDYQDIVCTRKHQRLLDKLSKNINDFYEFRSPFLYADSDFKILMEYINKGEKVLEEKKIIYEDWAYIPATFIVDNREYVKKISLFNQTLSELKEIIEYLYKMSSCLKNILSNNPCSVDQFSMCIDELVKKNDDDILFKSNLLETMAPNTMVLSYSDDQEDVHLTKYINKDIQEKISLIKDNLKKHNAVSNPDVINPLSELIELLAIHLKGISSLINKNLLEAKKTEELRMEQLDIMRDLTAVCCIIDNEEDSDENGNDNSFLSKIKKFF